MRCGTPSTRGSGRPACDARTPERGHGPAPARGGRGPHPGDPGEPVTAGERGERLRAAVPDTAGRIRVPGLGAAVEVWRDPEGVAHVRAASAADAFIAQGFVHAQDRLWQMHYDRRRAAGRSA